MLVALGVARYTINDDDSIQHRIAAQQRLSAVYLPLRSAVAGVIACVHPVLCTQSELLQAGRAANKATVAAFGQSETVDGLALACEGLRILVNRRLNWKRSTNGQQTRAARQCVALQTQISQELGASQ